MTDFLTSQQFVAEVSAPPYNTNLHWIWTETDVNFMRASLSTRTPRIGIGFFAGTVTPTSVNVEIVDGALPVGLSIKPGPFAISFGGLADPDGFISGVLDVTGQDPAVLHRCNLRVTDVPTGEQADVELVYAYAPRSIVLGAGNEIVVDVGQAITSAFENTDTAWIWGDEDGGHSTSALEMAHHAFVGGNRNSHSATGDDFTGAGAPLGIQLGVTVALAPGSGALPPGVTLTSGNLTGIGLSARKFRPLYTLMSSGGGTTPSRRGANAALQITAFPCLLGAPSAAGDWPGIVLRFSDNGGRSQDSAPMRIRTTGTGGGDPDPDPDPSSTVRKAFVSMMVF